MGSKGPEPSANGSRTMKAARVVEFGKPLELQTDVPVPETGPGQLLVRVTRSSLCMSDILFASGGRWKTPFCAGHEPVGVVEEVGPGVRGFSTGDRVGFMTVLNSCQSCPECDSGNTRYCAKRTVLGFEQAYGGFSEYCISEPQNTVKLPSGLSDEIAAPLTCAGITAYGALKKVAKIQSGGTVVNIIGCGGVGHVAILIAKAMGFIVHAYDIAEDKLQLARDCGADKAIDSTKLKDEEVVRDGSTVVITGAAPAYAQAFKVTAKHGYIVAVGLPHAPISINIQQMAATDIAIIPTNQGSKNELIELLDLAVKYNIKPLYQVREFDQINEGYEEMKAGKISGRLVYKVT